MDSRDVEISVKGISITGANKRAALYNASTKKWTWATTPDISEWSLSLLSDEIELDKEDETLVSSNLRVFPQSFDPLKNLLNDPLTVTVTFNETLNGIQTENNVKSATIKSTWEAGKIYSYQINLSSDHITFSEPTVTDWPNEIVNADDEIEF